MLLSCVRSLLALAVVLDLVACSSGSPAVPTPTAGSSIAAGKHHAKGKLTLRIRVPRKPKHRHGSRYLSYATAGITLAIAGPTTVTETAGLTIASNPGNCSSSLASTTCTVTLPGLSPCPSPANCYTATVATYDAVSCSGATCTIPGTANELSANQNVGFTIAAGTGNTIALTLDGIPTSVAVLPEGSSSLSGTASSGYTLSKCTTTPQEVSVVGVDADHNYILGAGAPAVTLTSNDTTHLAVATPSTSSPNRFALTPPSSLVSATIPNANTAVTLTAKATPLSGSGAIAASAQATVTFNSDVCGVISEYSAATNSQPAGIVTGPDDNLWFAESGLDRVAKITTTGTITEYTGATGSPFDITVGPDDNLWFTEDGSAKVGTITTTGAISEYSGTLASYAAPKGITSGPDGNLWFSLNQVDAVGSITTNGATLTQYTSGIPNNSRPLGITSGPDGELWFSLGGNGIAKTTTAGTVTSYSYANSQLPLGASPGYIVAGPDGAMWFTLCNSADIGRITLDGASASEYAIPSGNEGFQITLGPDGALWFGELFGGAIGRVTTAGSVSEFSTGIAQNALIQGIATGPDGALWFTDATNNKIGRVQ